MGADVERPPVWLMRQAGRYLPEFREISTKYPFRTRSETSELAIELSLQPWRRFQPDGVIFFSDILTPLPAMGVEFDVVKGKGPVIPEPLESNVEHSLKPIEDPDQQLPFIRPIFQGIREEVQGQAAVLGFVGSPWTIMAYAFEGSSVRHLQRTKRLLFESPEVAHSLLSHIADQVASYAVHQVECGADMVQVFDSWAHHLGPSYLAEFSLPYAERIVSRVHEMHPGTPVLYHANGSAGKLPELGSLSADVIGVDWATPLEDARQELGPEQVLQGNVDPSALLCGSSVVFEQAKQCWEAAGRGRHILNIGHGVLQGTPPDAPGYLCDASKALAGSGVA